MDAVASAAVIDPGLAAKVAFLRRPEVYPHAAGPVEAVETHMSWVFLAGERAYKLKKPVRYRHVDFGTLERRRRACEDEVRLNRRLAPDVYLGTVALRHGAGGELALGTNGGAVVDWLVVMRRLAPERMLDRRLARGDVRDDEIDRVVRRLARFYAGLPPEPVSAEGYRARLAREVEADRDALAAPRYGLAAPAVVALAEAQLARVAALADVLAERARAGRIVEGHGDLRPEHVCLEAEPVIIDCLEFDRELRVVDAAADVAFLALECRRLGGPTVGERVMAGYERERGDRVAAALWRLYQARHAMSRAKVAIWHLDDGVGVDVGKWVGRAKEYLALATELGGGG
jgi:aminoglycoside phosphotransferase family enzyme